MKYFLVNKELDYERGYLEQAEYSRGALRLLPGADYGVFFPGFLTGRRRSCAGTVLWQRDTDRGAPLFG